VQAGMGEHLSSFLADLSKFALHTRLKARAHAAPSACAARLARACSGAWRFEHGNDVCMPQRL